MAMRLYSDADIADIASAIRSKNGTQTQYKTREMGDAVRAIQTGEQILRESVTSTDAVSYNGTDKSISITVPVLAQRIRSFACIIELNNKVVVCAHTNSWGGVVVSISNPSSITTYALYVADNYTITFHAEAGSSNRTATRVYFDYEYV